MGGLEGVRGTLVIIVGLAMLVCLTVLLWHWISESSRKGTATSRHETWRPIDDLECSGDSSQFDAARNLILSELDGWPTGTKPGFTCGVLVEASGHHDAYSRNLNLTMRPIWLPTG